MLPQNLSTTISETEDQILSGIARSIKEAKDGKTYSLDTLWNQL
jgi:hypothetical protein